MKTGLCTPFLILVVLLVASACAGPRSVPPDSQSTWDVVIIGDSSLWDVGKPYAALVEQQRGVEVNLHDMWQSVLRANELLRALRGDETQFQGFEDLRATIRDAEVIVLYANPLDEDYRMPGGWNCFSEPYQTTNCSPEVFEQHVADMSEIYAEIGEIRGDVPVVLRAVNIYNPLLSDWTEAGVAAECTACWEAMNAATARAAAARGAPLVNIYDAFNGPGHDEDPRGKGYMKDGEHPSEQGAAFYAQVLASSGFDTVVVR